MKLPTDLAGITAADYADPDSKTALDNALLTATKKIKAKMRRHARKVRTRARQAVAEQIGDIRERITGSSEAQPGPHPGVDPQ